MHIFIMRAFVIAVFVGLTGCVTPGPYGNYAAASLEANKTMADATVTQLIALYPPAHTLFTLKQPAKDPYGAALVAALRHKGYSLMDFNPQAQSTSPSTTLKANPGVDLSYVVDAPQSMNLYRVTVQVGVQSISRAFMFSSNGKLYPAGVWVRKE